MSLHKYNKDELLQVIENCRKLAHDCIERIERMDENPDLWEYNLENQRLNIFDCKKLLMHKYDTPVSDMEGIDYDEFNRWRFSTN